MFTQTPDEGYLDNLAVLLASIYKLYTSDSSNCYICSFLFFYAYIVISKVEVEFYSDNRMKVLNIMGMNNETNKRPTKIISRRRKCERKI